MTTTIIKLDHLQKKFGKFVALSDVSFTLETGQILGFLGPNGAGKSTTIRIILGLLKSSGGSVSVFGKDAWQNDAKIHPRIAYIPGDVNLWPNLSGGEIIDLLLRLNNQKHNQKTDELIKSFELDPKKKAHTYSRGNRQKVALIAALSQDVDLYIFDEPTAGLDPLNEQTFQTEVLKLKKAGKSVLLSSHILSEVERMCDSIVIIREGQVIASGSLAQLRHLSRIKIAVATATSMTDISNQVGVYDLTYKNTAHTKAVFTADRDALGMIMKTLAAKTILDIQSTSPTLEDLFLRYYGKQGAHYAD
ncbi:ABC-2 type transport system ATP-binding protein [Weissella beninensis]|uniref:ABC transporter ATP-binding protein n=1 Tax=Periweissella beninensis TaxID=504936 RepID=A0ABT0VIN0_9LACO|nr:ABC transporter ATP-binding protein [Periweissella beninensis]MBM7543870.1 ABC-2 type transport system ATP-binding protein [Periweissella beninensis]MCM2436749.1 ABC transporter ATP-binding protein [Periweissella beninensis]